MIKMKMNAFRRYAQVMNQVDISAQAKNRIAHNCAKHATLLKIKSGKFTVTAVVKENSTDRI